MIAKYVPLNPHTIYDSNTTSVLSGIAYGNGQYVAVGSAGSIITSTDGVNWIIEETGTLNTLSDVIATDNTFLVVGDPINLLYAD